MNGDWIVHPALEYGLVVSGLALCLYLFFSLKGEARRSESRLMKQQRALEARLQELLEAMGEAKSEFRRLEREADARIEPPVVSSLNITRRSQVIRMHRRGETPREIAAALSVPRGEVELVLKIEQMAAADT